MGGPAPPVLGFIVSCAFCSQDWICAWPVLCSQDWIRDMIVDDDDESELYKVCGVCVSVSGWQAHIHMRYLCRPMV